MRTALTKHHASNNFKRRVGGQWKLCISIKLSMKFSVCLLGCRSYLNIILEEGNHLHLETSIGKYFISVVSLRPDLREWKELGLAEMLELLG